MLVTWKSLYVVVIADPFLSGDTAIDNKHEMELDEGCVTGAGEGRSDEDLATEGYVRSEEESDGDVSTEGEEGEGGVEDDDVDESQRGVLSVQYVLLPSARMRSEGTVVGFVCLSVCLSVTLHLTSRMSVRLTNDILYLTGNEGQKLLRVFSEIAPLQS